MRMEEPDLEEDELKRGKKLTSRRKTPGGARTKPRRRRTVGGRLQPARGWRRRGCSYAILWRETPLPRCGRPYTDLLTWLLRGLGGHGLNEDRRRELALEDMTAKKQAKSMKVEKDRITRGREFIAKINALDIIEAGLTKEDTLFVAVTRAPSRARSENQRPKKGGAITEGYQSRRAEGECVEGRGAAERRACA